MMFASCFLFALVAGLFSHVTHADIYTHLLFFSLSSIVPAYLSEVKNKLETQSYVLPSLDQLGSICGTCVKN